MIHPETRALLEYMLHMLDEKGEEFTFAYMRKYMVGSEKLSETYQMEKITF